MPPSLGAGAIKAARKEYGVCTLLLRRFLISWNWNHFIQTLDLSKKEH